MKKTLCLILILLCLFCLASCKKEAPEEIITPQDIPETLETAALTVTLTFPEGYTSVQIAELLEENEVCSAADFIKLLYNVEYLKTLNYSFLNGITNASKRPFILEGYVFPDTYEFYIGEGAEAVLTRFLDNTEQKLTVDYYVKAEESGYTVDEILTIASIIQEEAGDPEDMPNVSSVLHNRLESPDYGMLQCDVTINYINDCVKDSPYIKANVDTVSENYNTYECAGLPAGPICNPGIHAIEAALNPPETNYFFFVTDEQMNYYYAETYEEHQINCANVGIDG